MSIDKDKTFNQIYFFYNFVICVLLLFYLFLFCSFQLNDCFTVACLSKFINYLIKLLTINPPNIYQSILSIILDVLERVCLF